MENGAAVRLTKEGLQFMQDNIGSIASNLLGGGTGVLEFPVNTISDSIDAGITTIDYSVCPSGPDAASKKCIVEIDLANADFALNAHQPHNLGVVGTLPVRIQNLPIDTSLGDVDITLSGNQSCPGDNSMFGPINATVDLSIETDLNMDHSRYGYSKLKINTLNISKSDIQKSLNFCNGGVLGVFLGLFKSTIIDYAYDSLNGALKNTVEQQLCQKANPDLSPSCPTGTNDVNGVCRFGTDDKSECVSIELGTDGHANLGGLLANLSPGTKGGMDFLFAGGGPSVRDDGSGYTWGDLAVVGGGATLGIYGGVEPNPLSKCVPLSNLPLPKGIPIPSELLDDSLITDWPGNIPGPHVGIGVSERFFNYALSGMYNSGLLCLGVTTSTVDLLNTGTLSALIPSLGNLTIQKETQPVGIVIRPTTAPHVTFGNGTNLTSDPNILLQLDKAAFDFYAMSSDRFIRFMTATFDIKAPVNLTVTPDGLVPVLDKLAIQNGTITNNDLLKEDPVQLAAILQDLLAGQVGAALGGGLPAIDLNGAVSSFGLKLTIPPTVEGKGSPGLRKLTKGSDNYLGIFASLEAATLLSNTVETSVEVTDRHIDPKGLVVTTRSDSNAPVIDLHAGSTADDGTREMEYQARIDGGLWKPWQASPDFHLTSETFRLQGKHHIEVRARVHGADYTLDPTPAEATVLIDMDAPEIEIGDVDDDGNAEIDVFDLVSRDETVARYRIDDGAFSAWMPVADLKRIPVGEGDAITVEARDEEGHVATAQSGLIRGAAHGAAAGCACSVPTESGGPSTPALVALGAALAGLGARLRKRFKTSARDAGGAAPQRTFERVSSEKKASGVDAPRAAAIVSRRKKELVGAAIVLGVAGTYSGCNCGDDTIEDGSYSCVAPNCFTLSPGLIGSYTSTAIAGDALWVAGYLEADYDNGYQYGDLVVGKYDGTKVNWTIVDGVPTDPPVDGKFFNLKGFRGGQTDPGDDVGIWSSIAIDPSGKPSVAYYDRTNHALKFAKSDGKAWTTSVVEQIPNGDAGKYAKLHYEGNDAIIAYLQISPADAGLLKSGVRVARSSDGKSWTKEDVVTNDKTPCRQQYCSGGSICVADTGKCSAAATGCSNCSSSQQCVDDGGPKCVDPLPPGTLDAYPEATGLYISTSPLPGGGFGIAYYDRVEGSLNIAYKDGDWTHVNVDGANPMNPQDVGIGTSVAIDSNGDWHISYVDGYDEALRYATVSNGVVTKELVDTGLGVGGVDFPDGQHVIGDDSFITVGSDGTIRISYQDATNGKLRLATGTVKGNTHDWNVKVVDQAGFAGFFSSQVNLGGTFQLVNWWRQGGEITQGDVAVVSP
ncbi:MAG: hypothetical protein U0414_25935 [Polyangiaceae bacterium]